MAAILNYHDDRVTVLCPSGHFVTSITLDSNFGGSMAEAELAAHGYGQPNVYDRLADACALLDAKERGGSRGASLEDTINAAASGD